MKKFITIFLVLLTILNIQAAPIGEYFTYQGELYDSGQPATGQYDISVNLFEAQTGGNTLGGDLALNTSVVNGIFSVELDIGSVPFMGDEIWIELSIKPAGSGSYTDLPRQKITNSPYAIHAQFVGASGVNSDAIVTGSVTGIKIANSTITQDKLQSSSVGTLQVINASITNEKLANNAVTSSKLADNSVNTNAILNGTIVAADIDSNAIQQRVSGVCAANSSIRAIANDGSVTCETDDIGTSGWGLAGNAGTTPGTNFIGTTDNQAFIVKVNDKQTLKIEESSNQLPGLNHMNVVLGSAGNSIDQFAGSKLENSMILGGANNSVLTLAASESIVNSAVVGGTNNYIKGGAESLITGGANNTINKMGYRSAIVSGTGNVINSGYSFASGFGSQVTHNGGWVWNDFSDSNTSTSLVTTGDNQFLIRAEGGFGLGTNAPAAPMHIKGQGKTFGALTDEVVMTVEPKETTDNVSLAINKLDSTQESALAFTTNKLPEFDIRSVNGGFLTLNNYDAMGNSKLMMRIGKSGVNRIDIFADLEPEQANAFDFGSNTYRWKHIYTENITTRNTITTDSDRRLKDHIKDIDYGLADILAMRPVSYNLKKGNTEQKHLGFIAQEIKTIVPEIVSQTDDEKHMLSMRYSEIIPILIKATQEQQVLIEQQSEQINSLIEANQLLMNHLDIKQLK